ncbi:MAG: hypothetical protein EOP49_29015, partial [Sphingobacteriales bacterium]
AGLVYEFQPGALNEAFSDVLGETAEAMVYRNGVADWVSGANLTGPIRDMRNPGAYQQPGKMSEFQNLDRSQDNGGVHVNSGIYGIAGNMVGKGIKACNVQFKRWHAVQAFFHAHKGRLQYKRFLPLFIKRDADMRR